MEHIDKDHYLYDFSTQELKDILKKYDKWSEMDALLAQKILNERGEDFTDKIVLQLKKKRIEELSRPEPASTFSLVGAYILMFSSAILGLFGLLGLISILSIFIGYHFIHFKKNIPNGERVRAYNSITRQHGILIFYLSIIILLAYIFLYFIL